MSLKKVEAIVRPGAMKQILLALDAINYAGVTVSEVQGHGKQKGVKEHYRDKTTLSLISKMKVEVVCSGEKEAELAIEAIVNATKTGEFGDGKIFVTDLKEVIRIRTGETGTKAIN
ncbi:MAG: P-II family nitrogen regulator [candidate division FCPU426 bacterium]